jgi:hypothetical protein
VVYHGVRNQKEIVMTMLRRLSLMLGGIAFSLAVALPAAAAETAPESRGEASVPALQACPPKDAQRLNLAEVSQTDCCKGHKGVCGCRAGKIVCCDNTVSTNCTCHADDPAFIP